MKLVTLFMLTFFAATSSWSQCTSDAGTLTGAQSICVGSPWSVSTIATLDTNDALFYVAFTGADLFSGTIIATSTDGVFDYLPAMSGASPFNVVAVVGNQYGDFIDDVDPCLSQSNVLSMSVSMDLDGFAIDNPSLINCVNPTQILSTNVPFGVTYLWSDESTSGTLSVVAEGTYTVTVTSNLNGCTSSASTTVLSNLTIPTVSLLSSNNLDCAQTSATLTAFGDFGTITWGGPITIGNSLDVYSSGIYTVTATGTSGCTSTASIVVTSNYTLPVSVITASNMLSCNQTTVSLTVTPLTGVTYSWSSTFEWNSNPYVVNLPGTYTVTVTSFLSGCTSTAQIVVTTNSIAPAGGIAASNMLSCAQPTATLTASPGSGVTYLWNNAATTSSIEVNNTGTYTVTVTAGANGCTSSATIAIVNSSGLTLTASNAITCYDSNATLLASPQNAETYTWSPSVIGSGAVVAVQAAGTYTVIADYGGGCIASASVTIVEDFSPPTFSLNSTFGSCANNDMLLNIMPGFPNQVFSSIDWSNGVIGVLSSIANTPGNYCVTVTGQNGCTASSCIDVVMPVSLMASINAVNTPCQPAYMVATITGGTPPYTFDWSNGSGFAVLTTAVDGFYTVTITDAFGCTATSVNEAITSIGDSCTAISGQVLVDADFDCLSDITVAGVANLTVEATDGTNSYYGFTDANGQYYIVVPAGVYTVSTFNVGLGWTLCYETVGGIQATLGNIATSNFIAQPTNCPDLTVSIGNGNLRPCMDNLFFVDITNNGSGDALATELIVELPEILTINYSDLPYIVLGDGFYQFDFSNLSADTTILFYFTAVLDCDLLLIGTTICWSAAISSPSTCNNLDPLWSGASLDISTSCQNGNAFFEIKNVGTSDMTIPLSYQVISDATIIENETINPLAAGASEIIAYTAGGATYYLVADQEPFHPNGGQVSAAIEGCASGSTFSTGFINTYPIAEESVPTIDESCTTVTASSDPNDKQGFPIGYGNEHYILPNSGIEYLIRFQNTGTDTAFNIVIRDTLSQHLDRLTFVPGAGSHPFTTTMSGEGIIHFNFNDIMLPDSNINEPNSHGFVSYSIRMKDDLPLLTQINNTAAIYFDFNEPIYTNTTLHTVNENFYLTSAQDLSSKTPITLSPNPMTNRVAISVPTIQGRLYVQIFDATGALVSSIEASGPVFNLDRNDLSAGVYSVVILAQDGQEAVARLVVK
jgi:uncharacterized repeat protein (TIGR01451 family)